MVVDPPDREAGHPLAGVGVVVVADRLAKLEQTKMPEDLDLTSSASIPQGLIVVDVGPDWGPMVGVTRALVFYSYTPLPQCWGAKRRILRLLLWGPSKASASSSPPCQRSPPQLLGHLLQSLIARFRRPSAGARRDHPALCRGGALHSKPGEQSLAPLSRRRDPHRCRPPSEGGRDGHSNDLSPTMTIRVDSGDRLQRHGKVRQESHQRIGSGYCAGFVPRGFASRHD